MGGGLGLRVRLQELQSVADRVVGVEAAVAGKSPLYVVDGGQAHRCGYGFSLRAIAKMRRNGKTVPYGPGG